MGSHLGETERGTRGWGAERGQTCRQGRLAALSAASGHRAQGGGGAGGGGSAEQPPRLSHLLGRGGE